MAYKKKTIVIGFRLHVSADGTVSRVRRDKTYTLHGHWSEKAVEKFLNARGIKRGYFRHYSQFCEDSKSPVIYSDVFKIGY